MTQPISAPFTYGGSNDYGRTLERLILVEGYYLLADQTITNIAVCAEDGEPLWVEG